MGDETGTFLSIASRTDPYSTAGTDQLNRLRAVPSPAPTLFTGPAVQNQETLEAVRERLPLALAAIAVVTFIILFVFTGSVVLPIKALVLNTLSLSASFGAMIWIFQDGHLSNLLRFTPTGYIESTIPVLMFCVAFGLSMDYEVFLLSRIREEWLRSDRTSAANSRAVALGLARTGRIITAAAVLMAIVFLAMVTSRVSFIQLFGLGLALAVLVDATVVRGLLVPAVMTLMGRLNWWSPTPLVRLHRRIGLAHEPGRHRVDEHVLPRITT
jgi:RND superfamily putative drug exporter